MDISKGDNNEEIIAIIDHTEDNFFYTCKIPYLYKSHYSFYKKFWKGDGKNAVRVSLHVDNFTDVINALIKKI